MNKFMKIVCLCFALLLGVVIGYFVAIKNGRVMDEKKVAFRVELAQNDIDYDLSAMLSYLKCKYEKNGFKVDEFSYLGDLYPKRLNNAGINVFVRGYSILFDKRINKKAHNIYLVSRFIGGHLEEFRNFDEYMTIQKSLANAGKAKGVDMTYLEQGACNNKVLDRRNAKDIVYIFEKNEEAIRTALTSFANVKAYNTFDFAKLSKTEKENVFKNAKMVVYGVNQELISDGDYLGFAIYDILSYGVPVITNRVNLRKNIKNLYYFVLVDDLISLINRLKYSYL